MQLAPLTRSPVLDASGVPDAGLALASNMSNPVARELRAIRILLEVLLQEMSGRDIDITQFGPTEALEG